MSRNIRDAKIDARNEARRCKLRHKTALRIMCAIMTDPLRPEVSDDSAMQTAIDLADRFIKALNC